MSNDLFELPEYLQPYYYPLLIDDRTMEYMTKVKQRFAQQEPELFPGKDLFRLIAMLSPGSDPKVIFGAYTNHKKLKKGGMQDILLKLIPEMFIAGCVWETHGIENPEIIHRDSNMKLCKVKRHLNNLYKDKNDLLDQIEGTGMISAKDHEYEMMAQRKMFEAKIDDIERSERKAKDKAEMVALKHMRESQRQARINEGLEKALHMEMKEESLKADKAPDNSGNTETDPLLS